MFFGSLLQPKKKSTIKTNELSNMALFSVEILMNHVKEFIFIFVFFFRFMAKTCDGCQKKIIDETLIATNSGKHFHKDCYNNGQ